RLDRGGNEELALVRCDEGEVGQVATQAQADVVRATRPDRVAYPAARLGVESQRQVAPGLAPVGPAKAPFEVDDARPARRRSPAAMHFAGGIGVLESKALDGDAQADVGITSPGDPGLVAIERDIGLLEYPRKAHDRLGAGKRQPPSRRIEPGRPAEAAKPRDVPAAGRATQREREIAEPDIDAVVRLGSPCPPVEVRAIDPPAHAPSRDALGKGGR